MFCSLFAVTTDACSDGDTTALTAAEGSSFMKAHSNAVFWIFSWSPLQEEYFTVQQFG